MAVSVPAGTGTRTSLNIWSGIRTSSKLQSGHPLLPEIPPGQWRYLLVGEKF